MQTSLLIFITGTIFCQGTHFPLFAFFSTTALNLLDHLNSFYEVAKHSVPLEKEYGVDRASNVNGLSCMWYDQLGEDEKALEVCNNIIDNMLPQLDPTNTLGMFELLVPVLMIMHKHGMDNQCHDIFKAWVLDNFEKHHDPDSRTPCKPVYQPLVWLFGMSHDPIGYSEFDKCVEWLLDGDNGEFFTFVDNFMINSSWGPSDMTAELCLLVAQRLMCEAQTTLPGHDNGANLAMAKTIAAKGLKMARIADSKIKNKDGDVILPFANVLHEPTISDLEALTKLLDVYTAATERTQAPPGVDVNLPPSYLTKPIDAEEFVNFD